MHVEYQIIHLQLDLMMDMPLARCPCGIYLRNFLQRPDQMVPEAAAPTTVQVYRDDLGVTRRQFVSHLLPKHA